LFTFLAENSRGGPIVFFYLNEEIYKAGLYKWGYTEYKYLLVHQTFFQVFEFRKQDISSTASKAHTYILRPISGKAKYTKVHVDEAKRSGQALQNAAVDLDDVTLSLSKVLYSQPAPVFV
jgi:hypothetical protein